MPNVVMEKDMRILAVDDDPIILELLTQFVAIMGDHELTTALSGPEALDFVRNEPPPVCRRLQSKYGWSLWKKVTEQTGFQPRCAPARFG